MSGHIHGMPVDGSATVVAQCKDCVQREVELKAEVERREEAERQLRLVNDWLEVNANTLSDGDEADLRAALSAEAAK